MLKPFCAIIFTISFFLAAHGQERQEYMGLLKLNDSAFISYRVNFELNKGILSGYSVTDFGGAHETKSYIKGKYDEGENIFSFAEYGIEYTKSEVAAYDFCFVNFTGKLRKLEKQKQIDGVFEGLYADGESCIDGELTIKSVEKIYKQAQNLNKKIARIDKIPDSIKQKIDLLKAIDVSRLNVLKKNETTSVFWDSDTLNLVLWDAGKIDNDKITILFNGKTITNHYTLKKDKITFELQLTQKTNVLVIKAENMGEIHPNTAKLVLEKNDQKIDLMTNLASTEATTIHIIKK
jgi:hypothetical protein